MKVKMLKQTFFGKSLVEGDVIDVSEDVAMRFSRNGIATIVEFPVDGRDDETSSLEITLDGEQVTKLINYKVLQVKELFDLCRSRNIELEKSKINGKSQEEKKSYLISMLEAGD